jgi:hypothetical protein
VVRRHIPSTIYELAVVTPAARELDLAFTGTNEWCLGGQMALVPLLDRYGYVFTGCPNGVLRAISMRPPSIENTLGALSVLVEWAGLPWRAIGDEDFAAKRAAKRHAISRVLGRIGFVLFVSAAVALLRRR